jgi:predicted O-methyltransferase YrrM
MNRILDETLSEGHPFRTVKRKIIETIRHWRHDPLGTVRVLQNYTELHALKDIVRSSNPRKVLEIGSLYGGTLREWMQIVTPGALFVSIDLPVPANHRAHEAQAWGHKLGWYQWARIFGHALDVLSGDSTNYMTSRYVAEYGPFDFLFIDGGHDYETVSQDFQNYSHMVRRGGVIALHDIEGCPGVKRLWNEVKNSGRSHAEFVDIFAKEKRGIGVIHW